MALPELVTARELTSSIYGQLFEDLDTSLNDIIVQAEDAIQRKLGRRLKNQSYTEFYRYLRTQTIFVRNRPITSVTSVERRLFPTSAWETLDLSDMILAADAGYMIPYYQVKGYDVEVTYTAGYVEIPGSLKQAIMLQATMFSSPDLEIYGVGDSREPGIDHINRQIDELLEPFKIMTLAYV